MTLEKAQAEYGAVVRKIRWGEGPVYVCGTGDCAALGLAAGYVLEFFLGLPVVARPVEVFQSYGLSLLRPRSVLLMISAMGEWPDAQELALSALERGCTLVALANNPDSPLVNLADYVFLTPAEGDAESSAVTLCMHAALNFLAFEATRVLKKPKPWWDLVEKEFDQLPDNSSGCSRSSRRWSAQLRQRWRAYRGCASWVEAFTTFRLGGRRGECDS